MGVETGVSVDTEQIWSGFRARLLAYIRARSRTMEDAEDILQEVFLKVHRRIGTLEEPDHLGSWLYRVTHNTIVDYYRKRRPTSTAAYPHRARGTHPI